MSLSKPFEEGSLQNATQIVNNPASSLPRLGLGRSAPLLPPRPPGSLPVANGYNSMSPYSPYGGGPPSYGGYNSYGGYGGMSSGMPYRSSPYSSYGGYNGYGGYPGAYAGDDHERRFIQYAEESSRNTFASVENIVRAFNSLAMMVDNTFFAMTSSFRAVLSVAENFGRLRTMFGQIWYSVNVFRFISWLYRKLMGMLGYKIPASTTSVAWKQAASSIAGSKDAIPAGGSSWPTVAFLGMLLSAPYIISKFLPKYEDKSDPVNWNSPGIRAKAVFDFIATSPTELTVQMNDLVLLAPTYIQEEMHLKNSGWAFAVCKGKAGVVPLNYLVISKNRPILSQQKEEVPIPRGGKSHTKRVSFGETQVFENVDLNDYLAEENGAKVEVKDKAPE